jgi:hypothetical protein
MFKVNIEIIIKLEKNSYHNIIWLSYIFKSYDYTKPIELYSQQFIKFTNIKNNYISEENILDDGLITYLNDNNIAKVINKTEPNKYCLKLTPNSLLKLI